MSLPLASPPKNICILRLSAIGDVTHVLPTLRTLQANWPDAHITWIIGRAEAALVGDIPGVEFVVFDKAAGWGAYRNLTRKLKGRRFDLLLHMQISLRASLASLLIKAPVRLGFDRKRAKNAQWLFTNCRIRAVERQHVLEGFLEFTTALGLDTPVMRWDIPVPSAAKAFVAEQLPVKGRILAINPCSSNRARNWRNWDVQSYAAVIDFAAEKFGMTTVLTGGPDRLEVDYGRRIAQASQNKPVNLVGRTTLKELLAVLQRADVMISPDTGPAHMAASVGTPVIGLYASSNPERTGPYPFRHLCVNRYPEAVRCEFGTDVGSVRWGQRVRDHGVMSLITPEDVTSRLEQVLADLSTKTKGG